MTKGQLFIPQTFLDQWRNCCDVHLYYSKNVYIMIHYYVTITICIYEYHKSHAVQCATNHRTRLPCTTLYHSMCDVCKGISGIYASHFLWTRTTHSIKIEYVCWGEEYYVHGLATCNVICIWPDTLTDHRVGLESSDQSRDQILEQHAVHPTRKSI